MTIIETFMERHASLAEASVIDRPDLRDLIEEERGLTCGVYGCGRAALHRMFSPSDGEYTQANAVLSLLRGDMVEHLRCAACYHDEDTLIVEHLCPCSEIATLDVRVTGEMYRIIRRWFSPDLWAELSGPRYSTYRMCGACATETPSSGASPLREVRPGPGDRAALNTLFSRARAVGDRGWGRFRDLMLLKPDQVDTYTALWLTPVEDAVIPHAMPPSAEEVLQVAAIIGEEVTDATERLQQARGWLSSSADQKNSLLEDADAGPLSVEDQCELADLEASIRRYSALVGAYSSLAESGQRLVAELSG